MIQKRKEPNTSFSLFIIESLRFDDERRRREGRILRDILRLSDHEVHYIYIRTARELGHVLDQFQDSGSRYLHISAHGSKDTIGLTLDDVEFEKFGGILRPYLRGRRLFMSACEVANEHLARVTLADSGCYSLIGPRDAIDFDDAVIMWASFYHLMFRDPTVDSMKGRKIRWALRRVRSAFRREFEYFTHSDRRPGFVRVNIDTR